MTDQRITVDTSSFNKFARDLKKAEPTFAKALRKNMKDAGEIVAADARRRASFSARIPSNIKVRVAGDSIRVVVLDQKFSALAPGKRETAFSRRKRAEKAFDAPNHIGEAAALENGGIPGSFRHPVFGNLEMWVTQPARPFLHPALIANREAAVVAARRAVDQALLEVHSHGWDG